MEFGMGLSMRQSHRLEQQIKQLIKVELRQEIRLLLKQVLAVLQTLRIEQRLSMEQIELVCEIATSLEVRDQYDFCSEVVRRGGVKMALEMAQILEFTIGRDENDGNDQLGVWEFKNKMEQIALQEMRRRRRVQLQDEATRLALRFILREPKFWEGRGGTKKELLALLASVFQLGSRGEVIWALAGGWAVEVLVGRSIRDHHDIDTVILLQGRAQLADTDAVHPNDYFGVLSCTSTFVRRNCIQLVHWEEEDQHIWVLCPEFLFLSKFLNSDRGKDWLDIEALVTKFGAGFDMELMRKLLARRTSNFAHVRELLGILAAKDADVMLPKLRDLWEHKNE